MVLFALIACESPGGDTTPIDTVRDTARGDTAPPVQVAARVVEGGVVTCANPSDRAARPYQEWTSAAWEAQYPGADGDVAPWGMVVADLDGDGQIDILLPGRDGNTEVWMGAPGPTWVEDTAGRWAQDPALWTRSASAADWDADGDLDVLLGVVGPEVLYTNDGTGVFTAQTATGAEGGDWETQSSSWGDMDGDGDLDLFVANHYHLSAHQADPDDAYPTDDQGGWWGDPNGLFENLGDGTFADRSDRLVEMGSAIPTRAAGWYDVDDDGDQDLYEVNDKPQSGFVNVLERNDGTGHFTTERDDGLDISVQGMGLGVGDDNDDGVPDFVVTGWQEVPFLDSANDGTWFNTSVERGITLDGERVVGWGVELADLDNDGDLDVIEGNGPLFDATDVLAPMPDNPANQRIGLFEQGEDHHFSEASDAWGVGLSGSWRGLVTADLNGDGFLDVVVRNVLQRAHVFLSRCDDAAWLRIALRGPSPNLAGIGARVEVQAGDRTWRRWMSAGSTSESSTAPAEVHVGLGDIDAVDAITVYWADGVVTALPGVATRQVLTIVRADAPGA